MRITAAEHVRRENALASHRTIPEAAAALGISTSALWSWAKRAGLAISHEERHERTIAALRAHRSVYAAAASLGVHAQTIYARLAKHPELRDHIGAEVSR